MGSGSGPGLSRLFGHHPGAWHWFSPCHRMLPWAMLGQLGSAGDGSPEPSSGDMKGWNLMWVGEGKMGFSAKSG